MLSSPSLRPSQRVMPLASTTMRAVIGPASVSTPHNFARSEKHVFNRKWLADLYPELVCPPDQKLGKRAAANLEASPGTTLVFTICLETPGATPFDPNAEVAGTDDWSEPFGNAQLRHHWLDTRMQSLARSFS